MTLGARNEERVLEQIAVWVPGTLAPLGLMEINEVNASKSESHTMVSYTCH